MLFMELRFSLSRFLPRLQSKKARNPMIAC
jgi:hypothetical protein